jgi:hypothetical protein
MNTTTISSIDMLWSNVTRLGETSETLKTGLSELESILVVLVSILTSSFVATLPES